MWWAEYSWTFLHSTYTLLKTASLVSSLPEIQKRCIKVWTAKVIWLEILPSHTYSWQYFFQGGFSWTLKYVIQHWLTAVPQISLCRWMLRSKPGLLRLQHWQSDALTSRLDLIHNPHDTVITVKRSQKLESYDRGRRLMEKRDRKQDLYCDGSGKSMPYGLACLRKQ